MKFLTICAVTVVLATAALGAACNDDGGKTTLSLDEYFQQLDAIQEQADATFATEEASTGEPAADASGEELAAFLRDNLSSTVDVVRAAAADVDDLEPPDEAADANSDFVEAINSTGDALDAVVDSIPDTLTLAELENADTTFFNSDELNAADEQFATACNALEQVASDNGITVDLACEE